MSYTRSVYCSFCGERGHNRTGCPKRKQYIKDNPHSWEAIKEQRKQQRRDEVKAKVDASALTAANVDTPHAHAR